MEEKSESILGSARKNRDELVASIENVMKQLAQIGEKCNIKLEEYMKRAEEYDINYSPDMEILTQISYLIENLEVVKQKLENLKLEEDTILFDEEEYLNAAEKLIEKINIKVSLSKEEFVKKNEEKIKIAYDKKIETENELKKLRQELEKLEQEEREYKENAEKLENKKNKHRFLKWIYKGEEEDTRYMLSMIQNDIRGGREKRAELEIIEKANHFVPKTEGTNPEEVNHNEEKEQGKE